ncbi:MAG: lysozyme inhibitor LprI family protein [Gammaproteobacteria bacterium]|nr:lysozyme inhibitor LprI family protein [Gammaproteobacteria bacterium]
MVTPSLGCGAAGLDAATRKNCVLTELLYTDRNLNQRYEELRKKLPRADASTLRKVQREWLKRRDATCGLTTRARDRDRWLADIAESDTQATCVLQLAQGRITELEQMYNQIGTPPTITQVVPPSPPPELASGGATPLSSPADDYLVRSARTHNAGKFYFEVVVDPGLVQEKLEASLIARVSDGQHWVGSMYHIRPQDLVINVGLDSKITIKGGKFGDVRLPKAVIGVAVDLDTGRLYRHYDAVWQDNAIPGSPNGIVLPRATEFAAELFSSVQLKSLLDKGIVAINFGETPFAGLLPAGYRGFDDSESTADFPGGPQTVKIFPPRERVALVAQEQWVQRYWEWARSFPPGESPSQDTTGFRCGAGQNGPVWFLTGSSDSSPVRRECQVPEGKILLVPIANSLAQATPHSEITCDRLLISLNQFASGVTDLRLKIDSTALDSPERFLLGTGCFALTDPSSGRNGLAAGTGYWVFIGPLAKGPHELEFGGTFTTHDFRQDVRYVLHVQ